MTSKSWWQIRELWGQLWVRATLFTLLGILTAFAAVFLKPYIPAGLSATVGASAVDDVLTIIASSMLAVTTFTLSIMVQAFAAAATSATPRATRLLIRDPITQNVLATFLGSFMFALVGIVALHAGIYGDTGRVILFGATIFVIVAIILSLIQWFNKLTTFGRLTSTAERVEHATLDAIKARLHQPFLGGRPLRNLAVDVPPDAVPVHADGVGHIQHIDLSQLQRLAEEAGARLFLYVQPGAFVDPSRRLLAYHGAGEGMGQDWEARLHYAFTVGQTRTFEQDVRFGLIVLSEIAQRALSPSVNDPGTAIDIVNRQQRLLTHWAQKRPASVADVEDPQREPEIVYGSVYCPKLDEADLLDDAFRAIGRDGAAMVEVAMKLHKSLDALASLGSDQIRTAATTQLTILEERAEAALTNSADLAEFRRLSRP